MKEAYYFSHDSNARHDPKITAMRGVYGSEGYGWYWMLIEMMRESECYKLDMRSKYVFNAFALQMQSDKETIAQFINDCVAEFSLFESDGEYFWSTSLIKRMNIREKKSEKARQSAQKRWVKEENNAKNMQTHSENDANAWESDASKGKESKRNERKGNEIKDDDIEKSSPSKSAYQLFQNNIRLFPTEPEREQLMKWITTLGDDFVSRAVVECCESASGSPNFKYLKSIIETWISKGAKTVQDIENLQEQFKKEKEISNRSGPKVNIKPRNENLPEWIQNQPSSERADEISEEKQNEINQLLKALGEM